MFLPRSVIRLSCSLALATLALAGRLSGAEPVVEPSTQGLSLFKEHVAELLKRHCLKCHGGKKTEASFDLATRESLLHGGDSGPAIVPGKSAQSLLVKLLRHDDEPAMPYEEEKLPAQAIAQIADWIDAGAPYAEPLAVKGKPKGHSVVRPEDRQFWSFQPLRAVSPPTVKDEGWCRTPVDRFILARLETAGLAPNGPAERRILIRRASFSLTGLPPTPEEVARLVDDPAPDAYERWIERLLASPHYGERWGRHWLDLARFAESHGYEQDYDRPHAYHYRDFVIRALNDDLPYDTFVRWQIAGDEFEPDNPQALLATGFLGAGTHATQITANQAEKERYDELDDVVRTIGTSLLGLTVGCSRCHDHKYDPLPMSDYYGLVATFATTVRSDYDVTTNPAEFQRQKRQFDRQHAPLAEALARFEREQLPGRLEAWRSARARRQSPTWVVLEAESIKSAGGASFARQEDGSYLAGGANADFDAYTFTARIAERGVSAVRVEALAHPSLAKGGPGRADNGNFDLTDVQLTATPAARDGAPQPVKLCRPRATFEQSPQLAVALAIDGDQKSGWAVDPQLGKDHAAVFETDSDLGFDGGTRLTFTLRFAGNHRHNIGRLRLAVTTAPRPVPLEGAVAPPLVAEALARLDADPAAPLSDAQRQALLAWYKPLDPEWQRLNRAVQDHLASRPQPETIKAMICSEGVPAIRTHTQGLDFYDPTYFLKRGDPNQKGDVARPGFLTVLTVPSASPDRWRQAPPPGWRTSYRRRALANWITDCQAGAGNLLARVIVNRLWQHHFGRGIVATPSDFGAQGEPPSHPELLDYLAADLVAHGWKLKRLHKLLLTSSVYRQSARGDDARRAADPDNALCWHRARRRLEAEAVRDAMYAAAGLLDRTPYGPGSLDPNQRRRSIYFFVKRSKLVPLMTLFDAPDSLQDIPARSSTTVAPQALALLNGQGARACAAALAGAVRAPSASAPDAGVRLAYLRTLGREPSDSERQAARRFLDQQAAGYRAEGRADPLALAWIDYCQALLSLNEFIFVE